MNCSGSRTSVIGRRPPWSFRLPERASVSCTSRISHISAVAHALVRAPQYLAILIHMPRYAALDIGSNSIRMLAAETSAGAPAKILAAERQVTRLGTGVFQNGEISREAMTFVCENLSRMSQIYRKLDVIGVRAVATSAVRDAGNQEEFLRRASIALDTSVEIISGQEEARLIHLGVQARWPHPEHRVLIVDVGGGSAEGIHFDRGVLSEAFSRPLGAVRLTEVFLKADPPTPAELHRMNDSIEDEP